MAKLIHKHIFLRLDINIHLSGIALRKKVTFPYFKRAVNNRSVYTLFKNSIYRLSYFSINVLIVLHCKGKKRLSKLHFSLYNVKLSKIFQKVK